MTHSATASSPTNRRSGDGCWLAKRPGHWATMTGRFAPSETTIDQSALYRGNSSAARGRAHFDRGPAARRANRSADVLVELLYPLIDVDMIQVAVRCGGLIQQQRASDAEVGEGRHRDLTDLSVCP